VSQDLQAFLKARSHLGAAPWPVVIGASAALHALLAAGLTPILCVGETLDERDAGQTLARIEVQLRKGLYGLSAADVDKLVIAYEPVWKQIS